MVNHVNRLFRNIILTAALCSASAPVFGAESRGASPISSGGSRSSTPSMDSHTAEQLFKIAIHPFTSIFEGEFVTVDHVIKYLLEQERCFFFKDAPWLEGIVDEWMTTHSGALAKCCRQLEDLVAQYPHVGACYLLGNCYFYGLGVDQDYSHAYSQFYLAAQQGHLGARYYHAYITSNGLGAIRQDLSALQSLWSMAQYGYGPAQACLVGHHFDLGVNSPFSPEQAEACHCAALQPNSGLDIQPTFLPIAGHVGALVHLSMLQCGTPLAQSNFSQVNTILRQNCRSLLELMPKDTYKHGCEVQVSVTATVPAGYEELASAMTSLYSELREHLIGEDHALEEFARAFETELSRVINGDEPDIETSSFMHTCATCFDQAQLHAQCNDLCAMMHELAVASRATRREIRRSPIPEKLSKEVQDALFKYGILCYQKFNLTRQAEWLYMAVRLLKQSCFSRGVITLHRLKRCTAGIPAGRSTFDETAHLISYVAEQYGAWCIPDRFLEVCQKWVQSRKDSSSSALRNKKQAVLAELTTQSRNQEDKDRAVHTGVAEMEGSLSHEGQSHLIRSYELVSVKYLLRYIRSLQAYGQFLDSGDEQKLLCAIRELEESIIENFNLLDFDFTTDAVKLILYIHEHLGDHALEKEHWFSAHCLYHARRLLHSSETCDHEWVQRCLKKATKLQIQAQSRKLKKYDTMKLTTEKVHVPGHHKDTACRSACKALAQEFQERPFFTIDALTTCALEHEYPIAQARLATTYLSGISTQDEDLIEPDLNRAISLFAQILTSECTKEKHLEQARKKVINVLAGLTQQDRTHQLERLKQRDVDTAGMLEEIEALADAQELLVRRRVIDDALNVLAQGDRGGLLLLQNVDGEVELSQDDARALIASPACCEMLAENDSLLESLATISCAEANKIYNEELENYRYARALPESIRNHDASSCHSIYRQTLRKYFKSNLEDNQQGTFRHALRALETCAREHNFGIAQERLAWYFFENGDNATAMDYARLLLMNSATNVAIQTRIRDEIVKRFATGSLNLKVHLPEFRKLGIDVTHFEEALEGQRAEHLAQQAQEGTESFEAALAELAKHAPYTTHHLERLFEHEHVLDVCDANEGLLQQLSSSFEECAIDELYEAAWQKRVEEKVASCSSKNTLVAQLNLADVYLHGLGVQSRGKNLTQAHEMLGAAGKLIKKLKRNKKKGQINEQDITRYYQLRVALCDDPTYGNKRDVGNYLRELARRGDKSATTRLKKEQPNRKKKKKRTKKKQAPDAGGANSDDPVLAAYTMLDAGNKKMALEAFMGILPYDKVADDREWYRQCEATSIVASTNWQERTSPAGIAWTIAKLLKNSDNFASYKSYLLHAVKQGHLEARSQMARHMVHGTMGFSTDPVEGARHYGTLINNDYYRSVLDCVAPKELAKEYQPSLIDGYGQILTMMTSAHDQARSACDQEIATAIARHLFLCGEEFVKVDRPTQAQPFLKAAFERGYTSKQKDLCSAVCALVGGDFSQALRKLLGITRSNRTKDKASAYFYLGFMSLVGNGLEQSLDAARKYFEKALSHKCHFAAYYCVMLDLQMTKKIYVNKFQARLDCSLAENAHRGTDLFFFRDPMWFVELETSRPKLYLPTVQTCCLIGNKMKIYASQANLYNHITLGLERVTERYDQHATTKEQDQDLREAKKDIIANLQFSNAVQRLKDAQWAGPNAEAALLVIFDIANTECSAALSFVANILGYYMNFVMAKYIQDPASPRAKVATVLACNRLMKEVMSFSRFDLKIQIFKLLERQMKTFYKALLAKGSYSKEILEQYEACIQSFPAHECESQFNHACSTLQKIDWNKNAMSQRALLDLERLYLDGYEKAGRFLSNLGSYCAKQRGEFSEYNDYTASAMYSDVLSLHIDALYHVASMVEGHTNSAAALALLRHLKDESTALQLRVCTRQGRYTEEVTKKLKVCGEKIGIDLIELEQQHGLLRAASQAQVQDVNLPSGCRLQEIDVEDDLKELDIVRKAIDALGTGMIAVRNSLEFSISLMSLTDMTEEMITGLVESISQTAFSVKLKVEPIELLVQYGLLLARVRAEGQEIELASSIVPPLARSQTSAPVVEERRCKPLFSREVVDKILAQLKGLDSDGAIQITLPLLRQQIFEQLEAINAHENPHAIIEEIVHEIHPDLENRENGERLKAKLLKYLKGLSLLYASGRGFDRDYIHGLSATGRLLPPDVLHRAGQAAGFLQHLATTLQTKGNTDLE